VATTKPASGKQEICRLGLQKREDTAMNKQTTKRAVAVAIVGAVMLGSVPLRGLLRFRRA